MTLKRTPMFEQVFKISISRPRQACIWVPACEAQKGKDRVSVLMWKEGSYVGYPRRRTREELKKAKPEKKREREEKRKKKKLARVERQQYG